jgi:hypothetical protein
MPAHQTTNHSCRVYWGTHGCRLERGHKGFHECDCCICENKEHTHEVIDNIVCVAKYPYYGPNTKFYGEDA